MQRLRPLSEEECYLRCYGWLGSGGDVRVLHPDSASPEVTFVLTDRIRRAFEAGLAEESRVEAEAA
jgi:hypothetical protein